MTPEIIANQVLADFWDQSLPVDPAKIAKAMGIRIFENPSLSLSRQLVPADNGTMSIHINPTDSLVRKRFTVAHELGHVCRGHGPRPREDNTAYSLYNYDPIERDANLFAAALLMPESAVRYFLDVGLSLGGLSEKFKVSAQAMRIRLERRGVL
jgi:Zn-dependent peptidase ImmA (M78 family)